ncbi:MAG: hypothetical protein E7305_07270 [Butyrivibrio sp.]|nr:hypothetical protein [Butyrivibrio sp.]
MKKNSLIKDKKVLSALTIGISAMMFLQTPVSAYAAYNDELNENPPSESKTESSKSQSESSSEPVTNKAQTEATQAYNACVSETPVTAPPQETPAVEQTAETPAAEQTAETSAAEQTQATPTIAGAEVEANEAAAIILTGDADNNIPPAGVKEIATEEVADAVGELKDAATEVKEDDNIEKAAEDIKEVQTNLTEAETANEESEKADEEVVEKAKDVADFLEGDQGILKVADNVEDIVDETTTKGQELVQKIASAETDIDKQAAKAEFDKFVEENTESLNGQITLYDSLSRQYEEAVVELSKAQKKLKEQDDKFNDELNLAKGNAEEANKEVEAAQQKVEALANAMEKVQDAIADGNSEGADNLNNKYGENDWSNVFGKTPESSRNVMKDVIENYYLPEVLGFNLVKDKDHEVKFTFNKLNNTSDRYNYENNNTQVDFWYLDENNVLQQGTKYFNWDSIAKTNKDHENYKASDTEAAKTGIVMYEKTQEDMEADALNAPYEAMAKELLDNMPESEKSKYIRNQKFITHKDNLKRLQEQGGLRLYSYVDGDGNIQYITQFQLMGGYPTGKNPVEDAGNLLHEFTKTVDADGNITYTSPRTGQSFKNLKSLTVERNSNSLLNGGNCLIIGDSNAVAEALTGEDSFVKQNVVDRYHMDDEYVKKLIADNAKLNTFIDSNNSKNKQKMTEKYDAYAKEVVEAQIAVQNANQQVYELSQAIDDIREKSARKSKTMKATEALKTTDIAGYFGLTVGEGGLTEEEAAALNDMTLVELISELNQHKKKADEKVEKAKDAFSEKVKKIVADAQNASQVNPSGGGGDDTPDAGGDTTPDTPTTPAAPATDGAIAATTTTNPSPSAAPVLAAVEAAMAADAGAGQANPAAQAIADFAAGQADQGGAGNVEIADGDVALAETPDAAPVVEDAAETLAPKADIEDAAVALASESTIKDEAKKMNWWWILIVALLGVTGKKMYEEHMRKEEEKNKNKID